ncbi:MAG TPA: deoxyribodipyrimidine photo-lyase [Rhizobiaceae bacterium]|nr:deoxyribodipyrimidine photo-lyase [Rhizobiaceae bacterium]
MSANSDDRPDTKQDPAIVWFRNDLRLDDNPALVAAVESGREVIALYVHDTLSPDMRSPGGAKLWWLHHALDSLAKSLAGKGARLHFRRGAAADILRELVSQTGAGSVFWNRRYDPAGIAVDAGIKAELKDSGIDCRSFDGFLLHEPTRLKTGAGDPYKVYTPFWKAFRASGEPRAPLDIPAAINGYTGDVDSDALADWGFLPTMPDWAGGIAAEWTPGEAGAHARLEAFLDGASKGYRDGRDRPDRMSTSKLSPHLAAGEISPHRIWAEAVKRAGHVPERDLEHFLKEVAWREFSWHLLFHFPDLPTANFNRSFDAFPWTGNDNALQAWQRGLTGYPIVDAGMRQLWRTGWMHNRVRMIVGSFLIKDMMIDWRQGEAWFWDTLVDADPASNAASWQWVAGSGADAAPYFRIFNPVLQSEKFDPEGDYVRAFVPELAKLDSRFIHKPWEAPKEALRKAGVVLGESYPAPIVDHSTARYRALEAWQELRRAA